MLKLFAVLLGGRAEGCNTELHDVVFVVGESLEALYPDLVNKWFGIPKRLHIDSSVELQYVDGHEVIITSKKQHGQNTLFFANFGGYKPGFFGEIHEVNFYVAPNRTEALRRAKEELCVGLHLQHSDDHLEVDDLIAINEIENYHIQLVPTTKSCDLKIESHYRKLYLPEILEAAALRKHALKA